MKKIKSLFKRNYEGDRLVFNEVVPGAEWVVNGEGIATIKIDGTCCLWKENKLYKRYDAKKGRTPPDNFIPAQNIPDEITGHWPGWIPVGKGPEDRWHREGFFNTPVFRGGTYELVGPKVQSNPYSLARHELWGHNAECTPPPPRDFDGIRKYLELKRIEGIVWHRSNGDMVKIKRKDFGLPWPWPIK